MELIRLGIDDDRDINFDCDVHDLNEFFFNDSKTACKELISITYALCDNGKTIGFFCVSNDSINREIHSSTHKRVRKQISQYKRYSSLPAVKIGRLAIDKQFHGKGIGTYILNFIKGWFIAGNKTGCRFIVVDAINSDEVLKFYLKNGFNFFSDEDNNDPTRIMYFDLIKFKI